VLWHFFPVKARRQKIQEGGQLGEEKLITAFRARSENKMCIFWCAQELAGSQQQQSSVSHKVVISPEIRKKGKSHPRLKISLVRICREEHRVRLCRSERTKRKMSSGNMSFGKEIKRTS
jgi:hypothetical protein